MAVLSALLTAIAAPPAFGFHQLTGKPTPTFSSFLKAGVYFWE